MIQEYLLLDIAEKEKIENYKPDNIKVKMFSSSNDECQYVQFSSVGDDEETAKRLSEVDAYVRSNFNVKVLDSECSAYFNQNLYPLVSRFEYKLRKLLYLISAINKDEKTNEVIKNIEKKDFGKIFSSLFIDEEFMRRVKDDIKNRNLDHFTKSEILAELSSTEEQILWDNQIGKDVVPTLREKYNEVREARNSIMHSRVIGWDEYRKNQKLYCSINTELDKALCDIEMNESKKPSHPSFNQAFYGKIRAQEQLSSLLDNNSDLVKTIEKMYDSASHHSLKPEQVDMLEQNLQKVKTVYPSSPEMDVLYEQLKEAATKIPVISSELQKMQEKTKNLKIPRLDISPETLPFQKSFLPNKNTGDDTDDTDDGTSANNDEEGLK